MDIGKVSGITKELITNEAVLNKSSNILGMLFPYMGLTKKALEIYISDIEKSNMPSETKIMAVLNAKQTINKMRNQENIARIAIDSASKGTNFSKDSGVEEEWLERFMDSAGFVSKEEVQEIWGKILGKEFENPGSTPMNMLRILSEITPTYAQAFRKICSMRGEIIELDDNDDIIGIRMDIMVPYDEDNKEALHKMGLTFNVLNELETLGLLKFDSVNGFGFSGIRSEKVLSYVNGKTEVITKYIGNLMPSGSVLLTEAGKCLSRITPPEIVEGHEMMVKKYMVRKGVKYLESSNYRIEMIGKSIKVIKI